MIYVILGMHKSGTTLVTQMLHESGINMGELDEELGYDEDNKYERHSTQELNRELLHLYLIPPLNYLLRRHQKPLYDQAGYRRNNDSLALVRWNALQKSLGGPPDSRLVELVQSLNRRYHDWGFKDPRTCLTYPAWQPVLGEHRLVIVYRHYTQLLRRYRASNRNLPRMYRVLYSWTLHNQAILNYVAAQKTPAIVLSYEKLMDLETNGEYEHLCQFIGRSLVDVRDPSLYRNRARRDAELPSLARFLIPFLPSDPRKVYSQLEQARVNLSIP